MSWQTRLQMHFPNTKNNSVVCEEFQMYANLCMYRRWNSCCWFWSKVCQCIAIYSSPFVFFVLKFYILFPTVGQTIFELGWSALRGHQHLFAVFEFCPSERLSEISCFPLYFCRNFFIPSFFCFEMRGPQHGEKDLSFSGLWRLVDPAGTNVPEKHAVSAFSICCLHLHFILPFPNARCFSCLGGRIRESLSCLCHCCLQNRWAMCGGTCHHLRDFRAARVPTSVALLTPIRCLLVYCASGRISFTPDNIDPTDVLVTAFSCLLNTLLLDIQTLEFDSLVLHSDNLIIILIVNPSLYTCLHG
jgi:hypothetical protein